MDRQEQLENEFWTAVMFPTDSEDWAATLPLSDLSEVD
jgi:hypothetical protein